MHDASEDLGRELILVCCTEHYVLTSLYTAYQCWQLYIENKKNDSISQEISASSPTVTVEI